MSKEVTHGQYKAALIILSVAAILLFVCIGHLVVVLMNSATVVDLQSVILFPVSGMIAACFTIVMSTVTIRAFHRYGKPAAGR